MLPPPRRTALDRFLHILSGTEGATSPSEHSHFELVAIPKLTPSLGQASTEIMAERIETLWPIHADHHHLSVTLGLDESHGSTSSLCLAPGPAHLEGISQHERPLSSWTAALVASPILCAWAEKSTAG